MVISKSISDVSSDVSPLSDNSVSNSLASDQHDIPINDNNISNCTEMHTENENNSTTNIDASNSSISNNNDVSINENNISNSTNSAEIYTDSVNTTDPNIITLPISSNNDNAP